MEIKTIGVACDHAGFPLKQFVVKYLEDKGYNLVFNNCEHFAIWCKTGVFASKQVNALIDGLLP